MKLTKLHWLSALVIFAVISGSVVHLLLSADEVPANAVSPIEPAIIASGYTANELENRQHVTALTMKLAELQSHVLRLNALGERLADEANIPEEEFNFEQAPPRGGPIADKSISFEQVSLADVTNQLEKLAETLVYEEKQLEVLESLTLGHHIENTAYLSGRPITKGWLSSYYGVRKDPFTGKPAMHKGIDFAGKEGAAVIATAGGVVTWADDRYGYGQLIEINHGNEIKTRYGHNKTLLVNVGDVVAKGQVIARMGNTGRSTGPHVHYEIIKNNKAIDPIKYVYRRAK